jgi:hypothetical protein
MSWNEFIVFLFSSSFHHVLNFFWFVCFCVWVVGMFWIYWIWFRKRLFKDSKLNWKWVILFVLGLVAMGWLLGCSFLILLLILGGGV